ncbi:hypothetical protein [Amycolatopsis nigrescens]|uniref:hypothetical protein n=1 Tax=Amycolatopsis nigrescens TaxID=381445 RepID=UPI00037E876C|nr:hypothetical protein [Amycolatopsis nigrescens]
MMVELELVQAWESAYRQYTAMSATVNRFPSVDQRLAWEMAAASAAVASAWRALECDGFHPWWLTAAVRSAAEAFEGQAQDWEERARW